MNNDRRACRYIVIYEASQTYCYYILLETRISTPIQQYDTKKLLVSCNIIQKYLAQYRLVTATFYARYLSFRIDNSAYTKFA